jgi:hypothetical protein
MVVVLSCMRIRALRERQTRREAGAQSLKESPSWEVAGLSTAAAGRRQYIFNWSTKSISARQAGNNELRVYTDSAFMNLLAPCRSN